MVGFVVFRWAFVVVALIAGAVAAITRQEREREEAARASWCAANVPHPGMDGRANGDEQHTLPTQVA